MVTLLTTHGNMEFNIFVGFVLHGTSGKRLWSLQDSKLGLSFMLHFVAEKLQIVILRMKTLCNIGTEVILVRSLGNFIAYIYFTLS